MLDFPSSGLVSQSEPSLKPLMSVAEAEQLMFAAYDESLLRGADRSWFDLASVRKIFVFEAMLLGNVRRDYGDISFLTHLMEVTDRVYNCPELQAHGKTRRAIPPAGHDLEDIRKKYQLNADMVLTPVMNFLPNGLRESVSQDIHTDLFMLMDPLNLHGKERHEMQAFRILTMSDIAIHTRFFDKLCTYIRDLHNMRTRNPKTGLPYLHFSNEQQAATYLDKLAIRNQLIEKLPVAEAYKEEWRDLCAQIRHGIQQQLAPPQVLAEPVFLQPKQIIISTPMPPVMPQPAHGLVHAAL